MHNVTVLALMLAFGISTNAMAQSQAEPEWPVLIVQLKEQMQKRNSHPAIREQLVIAYNNYAVTLANGGNFQEASSQMEEALALDPSNEQIKSNLANIYMNEAKNYYQNNKNLQAKRSIEKSLELSPNLALGYVFLGEIEYRNQNLKEARKAWKKALEINPGLDGIQEKLDRLNQELPIESNFDKISQIYFDIRYNDRLDRASGFDIQEALLRARREIGSDFAHWPKHKLIVLVYSPEEFRQLHKGAPEWLGGQFDGKIRIPLLGEGFDKETIYRILFHEYTHAIIFDLTQNKCPTWLNEGLSEYQASRIKKSHGIALQKAAELGRLVPIAILSEKFSFSTPIDEAELAYEQSYSIAQYMVERYGFWRIRRLLKLIADEAPLEEAIHSELRIKLPKLESNWKDWLKTRLSASY